MTYYHINQNNSHFSASIITEYKDWKDYVKGGYYRPKSATLHKVDGEEDIIPALWIRSWEKQREPIRPIWLRRS